MKTWFLLAVLASGCASVARSAFDGDTAAVQKYLDDKGDPNAKFDDGGCNACTLLHHAASGGRIDVAKLLIEKGANINVTNAAGLTPLHAACTTQQIGMARFLLDHEQAKRSLSMRDQFGNTPLMYAVASPGKSPSVELVRLILDAGADVSIATNVGNTPLHIAAYKGFGDIVSLLLARGANREARNAKGETPARLAAASKQDAIVQMLNAPAAAGQ